MPVRQFVVWTGSLVGLAVILLLVVRYDPAAIFLPLLESRLELLLAVTALYGASQVLSVLKLVILLGRPARGCLSWWARTKVFLALQPVGQFAPGRVTDFSALAFLKEHYDPGVPASSIVLDRLITVFSLLLMTPFALRSVWPVLTVGLVDAIVGGSLVVIGAMPFILMQPRVRGGVNRYLLRRWPWLLKGFGAHTEFLLRASRARLMVNLGLTVLKTLLFAVVLVLLGRNVGLVIDVLAAVWMSVLIQLAASVPISAQGLGLAEGSLVLLFAANGFPKALALSISITARVLLLVVTVVIYFLFTVPLVYRRLAPES